MNAQIKHDPEADALYIRLLDEASSSTETIDDSRFVDYTVSGHLKGVEFLDVSKGLRVAGLPVIDTAALAAELRHAGFRIIDEVALTGQAFLPSSATYTHRAVESQPRLTAAQNTIYVPQQTNAHDVEGLIVGKPTLSGSVTISA